MHMWNNNGRIGMIVYGSDGGSGYKILFGNPDMDGGDVNTVKTWLAGDVNGNHKTEIVQMADVAL
jgi:hypothetical protein